MKRNSFYFCIILLALPALLAHALDRHRPDIRPQIPLADRNAENRVFLERADLLTKAEEDSFMVLVGNVVFTKGGMTMRCDSAHYVAETESMDAFGSVSMTQGDTLEVTADELNYNGLTEVAVLYANPGRKVCLRNRDVTLETDVFVYDLAIDLGYYEVGGTLTDPSNVLTSLKGEYAPSTKEANFYIDVHLNSRNESDTLNIYSDTLYYNTASHIAELHSPSRVVNARGTIYTSLGIYDTDSNFSSLYNRSVVVTPQGQTVTADSLYYDRNAMFAEGFGNMILTDSAHKSELHGDYGYYDQANDSSFVTGRAMLVEASGPDTLYLHSRYIQSFRRFDTIHIDEDTLTRTPAYDRIDTSQVAVAFPRVRFYRRDMQGICDSMRFTRADTMLRMFVNPVVWSEDRQIFGKEIDLKLNDSTIESVTIPEQAFTAQHIEGDHYNQLGGKEMIARFEGGELRQLNVNGNVEIIVYPEESDSTINKLVNAESSFLEAWFKGQTTEKIKMWPSTTGTATPLFIARQSDYFLSKFKWYEDIRPRDRQDIFIVPEMMEALMADHPIPIIEARPRSLERLRFIAPLPDEIPTVASPPEPPTDESEHDDET
ncbi:MAG: hypothetical protein K2L16_08545 [Muribaculaceae bacterium]|nr:hypothetical protein [Muribaculaceae bacterium]